MSNNMINYFLLKSIHNNNLSGVEDYLEMGASAKSICREGGIPALFVALNNQNPEICEVLCKNGADVGIYPLLGNTPLGYLLMKIKSVSLVYQNLNYINLRLILILLRYGNNPDYIEGGGVMSCRSILDNMGYTINNFYLITKPTSAEVDDDELEIQ